jgi:DNA-binding transcriptional LysR family regulator
MSNETGCSTVGTMSSSHIDVNAMLLFYEVINIGSINRAAAQLDIPKATVSRRLRALERHVGAVLLKRGARKLSMTASGAALYSHCDELLAAAQGARAAVTDLQSDLSGKLQIATAAGLRSWVNRALAAFAIRHPEVELIVDETHRWIDVSEEPYDIVIHLGRIHNERLPVRRLARLERGLYASPAYLEGRGPLRAIADLAGHSCIVLPQQLDDGLWRFRATGGSHDRDVQPRARVSDLVVAHELTLAGVGLAILPQAICSDDVRQGKLVRVLADSWQIPPLVAAATYLERRYVPLRIRALIEAIAAEFNSRPTGRLRPGE